MKAVEGYRIMLEVILPVPAETRSTIQRTSNKLTWTESAYIYLFKSFRFRGSNVA